MVHEGFEFEIDQVRDIAIMRYVGILTFEVAENSLKAAYNDSTMTPSTVVLLDTTRAHVHEIDVDWLRRFQALREALRLPWRTTALVVSRSEGNQLLGQLWATMRSMKSPESAGVFTQEDAAIAWLLERRESPAARTMSA